LPIQPLKTTTNSNTPERRIPETLSAAASCCTEWSYWILAPGGIPTNLKMAGIELWIDPVKRSHSHSQSFSASRVGWGLFRHSHPSTHTFIFLTPHDHKVCCGRPNWTEFYTVQFFPGILVPSRSKSELAQRGSAGPTNGYQTTSGNGSGQT